MFGANAFGWRYFGEAWGQSSSSTAPVFVLVVVMQAVARPTIVGADVACPAVAGASVTRPTLAGAEVEVLEGVSNQSMSRPTISEESLE